MTRIAIIGAGCSGTLVCRNLVPAAQKGLVSAVTIFDASGDFGPGLPYGAESTSDAFILNMTASTLGIGEPPDDFLDWLASQGHGGGYVPRRMFGQYLRTALANAVRDLEDAGVAVRRVAHPVADIGRTARGYAIAAQPGDALHFDRVVLAIGHLRKVSPFGAHERYFANPYHALRAIAQAIPAEASVGILGSKLTAIDMALQLREMGVRRIHMLSHSGRLPLVRGVVPATGDFRTEIPLEPRAGVRGFFRAFTTSRAFEAEYPGFFTIRDPRQRLDLEIAAAARPRPWQLFLDGTKHVVDAYWQHMDGPQQRLFHRKYKGLWMSYRHPMPLDNALKIRRMLDEGSLAIHGGYRSIGRSGAGFAAQLASGSLPVDYAIDATGVSGNIGRIEDPLVSRLIDKGMLLQHPGGGIQVHQDSFRVEGEPGLFAIGPLTQGTWFYVSAVERLKIHAHALAHALVHSSAAPAHAPA
ncbi:FAD/NAD(P)-binding protein [Acidovorax sp. NCPPB 2350]|nr:FAD/NAD(P)-binding protein [Acidovorax sp. NCPPB 2350]